MTKEVTAIGVPASQGNILFNGSIETVANTAGIPAWHWSDSAIPPGPLPNIDIWTPALRSWQNTSKQYYTAGGVSLTGYSTAFYYWSPSFQTNGSPRWASRPRRKFTSERVQYTTTVTPVALGLVALNIVPEVNLGVVANLVAESIRLTFEQGDGSNEITYDYYTLESVFVNSLGETVCVLPIPYTSTNPPGPGPGNIYIGVNYNTQAWVTTYVAPLAPSSAALYPVADRLTPPPVDIVVWP
jgi:hypothetical protein